MGLTCIRLLSGIDTSLSLGEKKKVNSLIKVSQGGDLWPVVLAGNTDNGFDMQKTVDLPKVPKHRFLRENFQKKKASSNCRK